MKQDQNELVRSGGGEKIDIPKGLQQAKITQHGFFLALVVLVVIMLAVVSYSVISRSIERMRCVTELRTIGASVAIKPILLPFTQIKIPFAFRVERVDLRNTVIYPEHLQKILLFPEVKVLSFHGSTLRDEDLLLLSRLSSVEVLNLYKTKVSDAGLIHIKSMPALRIVHLGGEGVSPTGVVFLLTSRPEIYVSLINSNFSGAWRGIGDIEGSRVLSRIRDSGSGAANKAAIQ